jgi:hypothetical protein
LHGLTEDGRQIVEAIADRHGVSSDAVYTLLMALAAGGGRQVQFNHPDLGGMGQWSQGGMIMVGDMFNQGPTLQRAGGCACQQFTLGTGADVVPAAKPIEQCEPGKRCEPVRTWRRRQSLAC